MASTSIWTILPYHFVAGILFWWQTWSPPFERFSNEWVDIWGAVVLKSSIFDESKLWYPGALEHYQKFRKKAGIEILKKLADRGVEPSFIMPVLISYAWNDEAPKTLRKDESIKYLQEVQHAITIVEDYYHRHFRYPAELLAKVTDIKSVCNIESMIENYGGAPDEGFEVVSVNIRKKVNAQLSLIDGISETRGKVPLDKNNRVVFTIYQHLLKATGGPQWVDFGQLLVASGIIAGLRARDGQIKPRIKSFEKLHPREIEAIIECVIP
jgi:hypothetical protein